MLDFPLIHIDASDCTYKIQHFAPTLQAWLGLSKSEGSYFSVDFPAEVTALLKDDGDRQDIAVIGEQTFKLFKSDVTDYITVITFVDISDVFIVKDRFNYVCHLDDDWTVVDISQTIEVITGYLPTQLIANKEVSYNQLIHPDDRQKVSDAIYYAIDHDAPWQIEYRISHLSGHYIWVQESGRLSAHASNGQCLVGTVQLIEHQKEVLKQKRELDEFYRNHTAFIYQTVGVEPRNASQKIHESLELFSRFDEDIDRVYVFEYVWEEDLCTNTYEWCKSGINSQIDSPHTQVKMSDLPQDWVAQHQQGDIFSLEDVSTLPVDSYLRKIFEAQGIKSLYMTPMLYQGKCVGFVGIDYVSQTKQIDRLLFSNLQIYAQLILNLLVTRDFVREANQSASQLKAVLKSIPDRIIYTDSSFNIIGSNDVIYEGSHQDIVDYVAQEVDLDVLRDSKSPIKFGRKTDKYFYEYSASVILGPLLELSGMLIIEKDITDRVLADQEVREANEMLSGVINNIPHVVFIKNYDGVFRFYNKKFCQQIGVDATEVLGETDAYWCKDTSSLEHFLGYDRRVIDSGEVHHIPVERARSEGHGYDAYYETYKIPINMGGEKCVMGIATEITDLIIYRQELEAQVDLFSEGPIFIIRVNVDDLSIESCTKNYDRIFDICSEHYIGQPLSTLIGDKGCSDIDQFDPDVQQGECFIEIVDGKQGLRWIRCFIVQQQVEQRKKMIIYGIDATSQRQAEQEKAEAQRLFNLISDNIDEVFWIRDASNTRMIYVNQRYAELFQASVDELYDDANAFFARVYEPDLEAIEVAFASYAHKRKFEVEYRLKDDLSRWIYAKQQPMIDNKGNITGHIGIAIEITELKQAQLEAIQNADKLASVLLAVDSATWEWDLLSDKVYVDKHWFEMIDSREQPHLYGADITRSYHPEDQANARLQLEKCFEKGECHFEIIGRVEHASGKWFWVKDVGTVVKFEGEKPITMYGTRQNIHLTQTARVKLDAQAKVFEDIIALMPIGVALNRFSDGLFLKGNKALLEPTGYTEEEFGKLSYFEITPKEYMPKEKIAIEQMQSKGSYDYFEKEYIRKDGTRYPVALRGTKISTEEGDVIVSVIEDISERKAIEQEVKSQRDKYTQLVESFNIGTWIWYINSGVIEINDQWAEMLGYHKSEVVPLDLDRFVSLIHPDDVELTLSPARAVLEGKATFLENEFRMLHKDGSSVYIYTRGNVSDSKDIMTGFHLDVTERRELQDKLTQLATIDELTQVYNRRYFFDRATEAWHQVQRGGLNASVALLDLDFFKAVNDTYGHIAGDEVLKHISQHLRAHTRAYDVVGRYGGEEFAILLVDVEPTDVVTILEKLRTEIEESPCQWNHQQISVTISIGYAHLSNYHSLDASIQHADDNLYKAKQLGRNQIVGEVK